MRTPVLLFALLSLRALAQVPNGGFENWTPSGDGYDQPDGWTTSNSTTFTVGLLSCGEGVDSPPEGSSYAIITTHTVPGVGTIPGTIHTGTPGNMGFPYTQRPASLNGQWQFLTQGGDQIYVHVLLYRWNNTTSMSENVGEGYTYASGALPAWMPFSVPIVYSSPFDPDSAFVEMTTSLTTVTNGSSLSVDDLHFELSTDIAGTHAMDEQLTVIADGELRISASMPIHQLSVMDMSGRMVAQAHDASSNTVQIDPLKPGLYAARAQLADGRIVVRAFATH